ncbi:MAG: hypothetical protein Q9226_004652 [Calogaya cf. arnoldii]
MDPVYSVNETLLCRIMASLPPSPHPAYSTICRTPPQNQPSQNPNPNHIYNIHSFRIPLEGSSFITTKDIFIPTSDALKSLTELAKQRASDFKKLSVEAKSTEVRQVASNFFDNQAVAMQDLATMCKNWRNDLSD